MTRLTINRRLDAETPGLEARPVRSANAYGPRQVSSPLSILTVPVETSRTNTKCALKRSPEAFVMMSVSLDTRTWPFADGTFELVISRHPVEVWWHEIARVLQPGGTYFAQHVGPHSLRSLSEFLMGALPDACARQRLRRLHGYDSDTPDDQERGV